MSDQVVNAEYEGITAKMRAGENGVMSCSRTSRAFRSPQRLWGARRG